MCRRRLRGVSVLFLFLFACTTHTAKTDADTVVPDGDVPTVDDAVEAESDDFILVEADEALPDADTPVSCLSMKIYENVKKAGFPLKDTNDKITFCRPGCDTPTENDPQCVRNLWEWINWTKYQDYKNGKTTFTECYPWPCELVGLKSTPITYSVCDKGLGNGEYSASMGTLYDLKIQNGKVGIVMNNGSYHSTISYDIEKDTYTTVAYASHASGYSNERFIFYTTGEDYVATQDYGNTYILSAKNTLNGYRYEVIYSDNANKAWFSRPPLVGEKWVVLNVEHRTSSTQEVVYAKVDEWQWRELKFGKIYEGNIVDNRLTFITDQREIYVCDLDKLPFDPAKECTRIDRAGETAYQPRLNEEDKNQLVYFAGVGEYGITLVDLSGATPQYTLLPATPSETQAMGTYPDQFKGNIVLNNETFMPLNDVRADYKACFYRVDLKKNYCPSKPTYQEDGRYDQGYNSFDGNYQLWKTPSGTIARFRDIQCYCEKEGLCPFEGLTR